MVDSRLTLLLFLVARFLLPKAGTDVVQAEEGLEEGASAVVVTIGGDIVVVGAGESVVVAGGDGDVVLGAGDAVGSKIEFSGCKV